MSFLTGDWDAVKNIFSGDSEYDAGNSEATAKLGSHLGLLASIMGGVNAAIGSFYSAKSAQYQQKSEALSYQFRSDMDAINARSAEYEAQAILEAGHTQVANYTMRAGQEKAATTARTAAHGVVLGVGSTRDVAASQDIVKDIDVMTLNSNAVRAASAARTQATNYKNQSLLENVSAVGARRSAKSISPFTAGFTSLLGSASMIANQWLQGTQRRKTDELMARGSY